MSLLQRVFLIHKKKFMYTAVYWSLCWKTPVFEPLAEEVQTTFDSKVKSEAKSQYEEVLLPDTPLESALKLSRLS